MNWSNQPFRQFWWPLWSACNDVNSLCSKNRLPWVCLRGTPILVY